MRVGLVIYGSLETLSGGFLYDRKLVEYLRGQGDSVEVVSIPWRGYARSLADNLSPGLYRRLAELEADVLLQDELNHPSLFWLNRRLKRQVSYPLVSIVHHLRLSEDHSSAALKLYRLVERAYLRTVDGFIFNSQTTRRSVEQAAGIQKPGVVAYPGGQFHTGGQFQPGGQIQPEISGAADIGANEIVARACQPGPVRVLFVGNLIPRKGLHTLLAALERIPSGAVTLTVAGGALVDSRYGRALRAQIEASRHAGSVHLTGPLPAAKLAGLMRQHHLMAVPSSYEGYGIVYLEGMGFGLPAIATTSGAAGEIITHGQDGFLVPPDDPVALAGVLTELSGDRQKLAAMSLAARERYRRHPGWEQGGEAIRDFIHNVSLVNRRKSF